MGMLKTYKVTVIVTETYYVEVEATSAEEALQVGADTIMYDMMGQDGEPGPQDHDFSELSFDATKAEEV